MRNPNRGVTSSVELLSLDLKAEVETGEQVPGRDWLIGVIETLACAGSLRRSRMRREGGPGLNLKEFFYLKAGKG